MSAAALLLGLALSATPVADDAAKKYEISFDGTTKDVKKGAKGTFSMSIKPAEGYKVSNEAPLKIKLDSKGLALAKKTLKTKDAKEKWEKSPAFAVDFSADAAGAQTIDVKATFFVCDVKICERKTEKLSVPVSVRQ